MKKIFSYVMGATIALSLLSSCKQNNLNNIEETTKIYSSIKGDVKIPPNPQRIVSDFYIGEFMPLDIMPIGTNKSLYANYYNPLWDDFFGSISDIGDSIEKVIELNPDLIITIDEQKYENYKKVAPTVLIPYGTYEVRELMVELGKITNTEEKSHNWINSFDEKVELAKTKIEPYLHEDSTFSTMEIWDNKIFVYGDNWGHGGTILYNELGVMAPEKAQNEIIGRVDSYAELSVEVLPEYLGDVIFYITDPVGGQQELEQSSIWMNLPAYNKNQIYKLDKNIYYNSDPVSLEYQLNELVDFITNNVI